MAYPSGVSRRGPGFDQAAIEADTEAGGVQFHGSKSSRR